MKRKIVIFIVVLIIFICSISCYFFFFHKEKISERKYQCIKLQEQEEKVEYKYLVIIDKDERIQNFNNQKKYILSNKTDFFNKLYTISLKNVKYDSNEDELSITIYGYDGEIINENGEVIYPNYLEYLNQFIDDSYECEFIK